MANHERQKFEFIPGTTLQIPKGEIIVDKNTGMIGIPGGFYGETSVNGFPINQQTLEDYHKEKQELDISDDK